MENRKDNLKNFIFRNLPRLTKRVNCVFRYFGGLPEAPQLPPGLSWDYASADLIERMFNKGFRKRVLKGLLLRGVMGIIIHDGRQWVAHGFVSPPGITQPQHLPQKMVKDFWWFFFMHTRTAYRHRGLQKCCISLRLLLVDKYKGQLEAAMVDTDINNVPAKKGIRSSGFKPNGIVTTLYLLLPKIGPRVIWWSWDKDRKHPAMDDLIRG